MKSTLLNDINACRSLVKEIVAPGEAVRFNRVLNLAEEMLHLKHLVPEPKRLARMLLSFWTDCLNAEDLGYAGDCAQRRRRTILSALLRAAGLNPFDHDADDRPRPMPTREQASGLRPQKFCSCAEPIFNPDANAFFDFCLQCGKPMAAAIIDG